MSRDEKHIFGRNTCSDASTRISAASGAVSCLLDSAHAPIVMHSRKKIGTQDNYMKNVCFN